MKQVLFLLIAAAEPTVAEKVAAMKALIKPLTKLAEEAKEKKDGVRAGCVNEKAGQAQALIKVAERAEEQLKDAQSRNDKEEIAGALRKLGIAAAKAKQVDAEARACVGQSSSNKGDTKVIVQFSGKGDKDPTVLDILDLLLAPELPRPVQVSPYQ